jgi:hypothetical protein
MTRWCALLLVAAIATPARAHFIWLVPDAFEPTGTTVRVIFSESLEPDSPDLLKLVDHTELFRCTGDGQPTLVEVARDRKGSRFLVLEGKGPWEVAGVCRYGVVRRGQDEPFLLMYYPKTYVRRLSEQELPHCRGKGAERLALEITPVGKERGTFVVTWHGKPLSGAEVAVVPLGETTARQMKADEQGRFTIPGAKTGIYGLRARHVEDRSGEEGGKKYHEVRHYATLVLELGAAATGAAPPRRKVAPDPRGEAKGDPEATRLLEEARAARATWARFPGFTADVTVNLDGRSVSRGRVEVKPDGKVHLDLGDPEAAAWARRELGSIVGHRLGGAAEPPTPCAFADDDETNPLGRAIRVLNDEYHSSYRIRDRQILVVNRAVPQGGVRFTITVLENRRNEDGHYLPVSFVVNTWGTKDGVLQSSEAHHQTWVRVGSFDLPKALLVVTAKGGKQEARSLKLTNHQLR